ncbi:MAG: PstS family phosphate ABC transporter substrate-binding protein [Acidobacteriota bacterium]|nr:PstS family phosphate ABC transporter substrate-binding protein [Acidobacteriota bacterium]
MKRTFPLVVCLLAATALTAAQALKVDSALTPYQRTSGVSGSLNSVGSDTMNNMMTLWAETFRKFYPNVKVQVEGKGSSTAPPALIAASAQFGPMSRRMRATEIDQFEARHGYKPTELKTSYDALAVYVHKDNPIEKLTLAQVEAVFGKSRRRGFARNVATWGQLGLTGDWANRPISIYGRNAASGTYGFFKEHVLKNGDYKDTVKEQPGSASVVQGITEDRFGIGYSGIGYRTSGVKAVALAETDKNPFSSGSYEDVQSGKYPLWRFLYIYVNKAPNRPADPLVAEFVKLMFSREGQEAVVKDGYMPLSARQAQTELAKVAK